MDGILIYISTALLLVLGLAFVKNAVSRSSTDSLEPPVAPSSIPLVGHVLGLSRRKFDYYNDLSKKIKSPIFTLVLPGQKMYVVTSPDLVQMVQKQHQILSFTPIESRFSLDLLQPSQTSREVLHKHLANSDEFGIHVDNRKGMREGTTPGPEVDQMNRAMIQEVSLKLEEIAPATRGKTVLKLYAWLEESLSIATTNSVYGEQNPYKDPDIRKAFWRFEQGLMKIILLPQVLARAPIAARNKVAAAFKQYYLNKYHETASLITRNRYSTHTGNGIPLEDMATFEVGGSIAFLVNTVPATFWFLHRIYSTPSLLSSLRAEIDAVARTPTPSQHHLDMTRIKSSCPLLLSTYRETLRHHAMGMTVRQVTTDTQLAGYTLKAGAMIQMPTRVIHTDPTIWGADVDEFRPRRFMKGETHQTLDGLPPKDVYFRAFGGGKTLCPGRHFATNEVLAVAALFIARFDVSPVGGGEWVLPSAYGTSMAAAVMTPDSDIEVEIERRQGFEDAEWRITLTDSDLILPLTAEDQM